MILSKKNPGETFNTFALGAITGRLDQRHFIGASVVAAWALVHL